MARLPPDGHLVARGRMRADRQSRPPRRQSVRRRLPRSRNRPQDRRAELDGMVPPERRRFHLPHELQVHDASFRSRPETPDRPAGHAETDPPWHRRLLRTPPAGRSPPTDQRHPRQRHARLHPLPARAARSHRHPPRTEIVFGISGCSGCYGRF